ncbi:MAG: hypothetical protein R6X31_00815, partial [Anaerolineae bacterium]
MPVYEADDQGYRIIGYNGGIEFYDPDRVLQCTVYLGEDNQLYICGEPMGSGTDGGEFSADYVREIIEGPGIDITNDRFEPRVGLGGDTILLYDSGGNPVAEYAATSAGLDSASSAAASGDVVWLPAATISGDHTLAAGVHYIGVSRWASILTGEITLGDGTTLECCTVERT